MLVKLRAAALVAASCLALATPGQAADKTLKAVVHADVKIVDTTWTTTYITNRFGYVIYDTLFALNAKFEPKPQMVDTWTVSDDQLTWTFKLRPGLKFHDGAPVTAADVIASLNRWDAWDPMGQQLRDVLATAEAVDADTFRFVLKQPYALLLDTLAKPTVPLFVMPAKIASTPRTEQITATIGSGPFVMQRDQWRPGDKVIFTKNAAYVPRAEPADYLSGGKVVKLDRLEWLYIPDANTALSALMAGEVDYFEMPPLDFITVLKDNPDIKVIDIDRLGVQVVIRPNSKNPPFDNYKGRQALAYMVNQADMMQAAVGNPDLFLKYCGAYFLCNSANETEAGAIRKPDMAKAKQLLKEAGYNGEKVVALLPTDRTQYNALMTVLISEMRAAGMNVDVQAADWSTISIRRAKKDPIDKGGWSVFITTQVGPDVSMPVTNAWFSSACDKANNGWACDDELQGMIAKWTREADVVKRHAMIPAIQERAYVSLPYIPGGQYFQPIAVRKNITGVVEAGLPVYWNIEKK